MTKEERELLVKDLRGRIGYNVKVLHESWNYEWDQELSLLERVVGIDDDFVYVRVIDTHTGEEYREDKHSIELYECKPYLRSMSDMTEEEKEEYNKCWVDSFLNYETAYKMIDWLNSHHFDYRGLLEKNLAMDIHILIDNGIKV